MDEVLKQPKVALSTVFLALKPNKTIRQQPAILPNRELGIESPASGLAALLAREAESDANGM